MDNQLFRKLNALIRTDEQQDRVRLAVANGQPDDQRLTNFTIRNQELRYIDREMNMNLLVISNDEVQQVVAREYQEHGLGSGFESFYKRLQNQYLNITRKSVRDYLQTNPTYVLAQPRKQRVNKPILSNGRNHLWAIDLVDMSESRIEDNNEIEPGAGRVNRRIEYRYIFSCIDIFTRFAWARPLTFKTAEQTSNALASIIEEANERPRAIMSDQGTEFAGAFAVYCKRVGIKRRLTRSYIPQANGIVERWNLSIRRTLNHLFLRNRNLRWYDMLPEAVQALNTKYHSTIKTTPQRAYENTAENEENQGFIHPLRQELIQAGRERMEEFRATEFEVGDRVFLDMSVYFSGQRAKVKAGRMKELVAIYMPQVFEIHRIINPGQNVLERRRYQLKDVVSGNMLKTQSHKGGKHVFRNASVFASSMVECRIEPRNLNISVDEVLRLNGVERRPRADMVIQA